MRNQSLSRLYALTLLFSVSLAGQVAFAQIADDDIPADWRACAEGDSCVDIPKSCCACDESEYIGVNSTYADQARALLTGCELVDCADMMCQQVFAICHRGQCVASHEEDTARLDQTVIEELIGTTQRAGFVEHDFESYMSLWADDVQIVGARGPEAGPFDFSIGREAIAATRGLRFSVPPQPGSFFIMMTNGFELEGDVATLLVESTTTTQDSSETVAELYKLRWTDGRWQAFENRWWPERSTNGRESTVHDEAHWSRVDAEVEAASDDQDARAMALANAYRFSEALVAYRAITDGGSTEALAWSMRGNMAMVVGEVEEAITSFNRARSLDSSAFVPDFIPEADAP